jgi:hypothetical protein
MSTKRNSILEPDVAARALAAMHSEHAELFELADRAHALAVQIFKQLDVPRASRQHLISASLYARILTSFESIYLLAERGRYGDAATLLRALAESAIVLEALVADPLVVTLLDQRDIVNERKLITAWLEVSEPTDVEQRKQYEDRLAEIKRQNPNVTHDPVNVEQLARKHDMLWLYATAYRYHSSDATHTTLHAIDRHILGKTADEITGLQFGPDGSEASFPLSSAISPLMNATEKLIAFFGLVGYKSESEGILAAWGALPARTRHRRRNDHAQNSDP